jgi:phage-related tail protein
VVKKGDDTSNNNEIQRIIAKYFENLYFNKVENLEEIHKFLDTYDQLKLNQENINHLKRSITSNEIQAIIESPKKEYNRFDELSAKISGLS